MKISRHLLLVALMLLNLQAIAQVSFGRPELFNNAWKFTLANPPGAEKVNFDDSKWENIQLPHDWSVKGQLCPTLASATGFLPGGVGWYRKTVRLDRSTTNEKSYLYFEGVYNRSEVFVNGQSVGVRPNGYISVLYDITPYLQFGQENTIAVKVDHSQSADSRWYTGSGIYRDVWLVRANPVHIAQWGVFADPELAKDKGKLHITVELKNGTEINSDLTVVHELLTADNKLVTKQSSKLSVPSNGNGEASTSLEVKSPILWNLDQPYLYQLRTTVYQGKTIIDSTTTATGFRTFSFDPEKGFALNGQNMKVKGVCLHHDAGVLGSAVPKEVLRRRILTLKEVGVNAIRTSHNPQAPALYALCDELGMMVLNEMYDEWEFPKRKWLEGWNVGTPGFQGSFDYFEQWGERDLADFVRRDRNHLSVFAWSIGNEVDYPNDPYSHPVLDGGKETGFTQAIFGGYKVDAPDAMRLGVIAKRLAKVVKTYDPSRAVTAGLAGVAMSNQTEYPGALDIAGYNYTEGMYANDHKKYPKRVIYGSENRHELSAWRAVTENEYIFGQFLWTGIDYLGESGRWPSRGFYSGLLDFGGFIKPRGYFRQSIWSNKPMTYIGTYPAPGKGSKSAMKDVWSQLDAESEEGNYEEKTPSMDAWPIWNYTEGQPIRVVAYTNAAQAKLLLNGKEVGSAKLYDTNTGIIHWDILYQAGKLEVQGLDKDGKEVSRSAIQTSKQPYALKVTLLNESTASQSGLAQVLVQVLDEDGVLVRLSDNEVTCHLAGPAKLLGLEASNNEDMSDYTDNKQRVFQGSLLAYIQTTGEKGAVKVRFTAPWLKSDELTIE